MGDSGDESDGAAVTFSRQSHRGSESDLRGGSRRRRRSISTIDESYSNERTALLSVGEHYGRRYNTQPATPRPRMSRVQSAIPTSTGGAPAASRTPSFTQRLSWALSNFDSNKVNQQFIDDRVWYDQFTSIDWVHDAQKDAYRLKQLRSRKDVKGRVKRWLDGGQGWILVAIIGAITAAIAFFVDVTERVLFDWKFGYCKAGFFLSKKLCCLGNDKNDFCPLWVTWSEGIFGTDSTAVGFIIFTLATIALAVASCLLTLTTQTVLPGSLRIQTVDEDLSNIQNADNEQGREPKVTPPPTGPITYYSAAGSGVAEVKVILSGFVLHGYLGFKTLVVKTLGLILSVSSGMSLGKEGPFVHVATCVGNIACRLFDKYNYNDAKRREMLSASAASGVAVAFGAPIGGVLFSLEEVSYYFPSKTLFRTLFCCIVAALSLKFLNPYGTNKIVLFEVRYTTDWHAFELAVFILLGVCGGVWGAMFIKASKYWATRFRQVRGIKGHPLFEVILVAALSAVMSYWNRYTKLAVTELLYEVASPCTQGATEHTGLCPEPEEIPFVIKELAIAFVVKSILTVVTFGIKVPAGIYVPTMVIGGLLGHLVGLAVEYAVYKFPDSAIFASCPAGGSPSACVVPGVYALVAAGAVMCGVTRLSVTLVVILFELTGSLDHVLPFSLAILVSKWTADALEPRSIYDLLTDLNSYPFLDNKQRPIFVNQVGDITPRVKPERIVDITESSEVEAVSLRRKLRNLQAVGELDGGLPIVRKGILVGLIPAPDLEFALDNLDNEEEEYCRMAPKEYFDSEEEGSLLVDKTDFTPYIDPAPLALERCSPMDLAYECFVKLGLRYICVLHEGKFVGIVHKKVFVKFLKEQEHEAE